MAETLYEKTKPSGNDDGEVDIGNRSNGQRYYALPSRKK